MNKLNEKIQSSFDTDLDRAQVMGNYGYNTTTSKWNRLNTDGAGALNVNVHGGSTGSGDLKARTTITDPSSSTFLKCTPDGSLELTAELDTSALAKESVQTNGTQISKIQGVDSNTLVQRDCKQNSNGDLRTQLIGNDGNNGAGTMTIVKTNSDGELSS